MVFFHASVSWAAVVINEIMYHPATENPLEEYIELFNAGATNENLNGWYFGKGVQFYFPNQILVPNSYLVVAADLHTFTNKYPAVTNVIGNWFGHLSHTHETIELENASGVTIDKVSYADEGDWATRQRGPTDHGHRGWTWFAAHDGGGKSLELINKNLPNDYGQNWNSSLTINGTPGAPNSVIQGNIPPLILDVQHSPAIPKSTNSVVVTAKLLDEHTNVYLANLFWKLDGAISFNSVIMLDDGFNNDGAAQDGIFAATIPPQTNNAIVEFYIRAIDEEGLTRTWPAPAIETNGVSLGQIANALYQVDNSAYTNIAPLYKFVMKETNRVELANIGSNVGSSANSDAEMNTTFISVDGAGEKIRYLTGVRNRGHGSRTRKPNSYRVNFPSDHTWNDVTSLNLNGQYSHSQVLGSVLSIKSGLVAANSRAIQLRVNNTNLANTGPQTYGGMYAANETIGGDWADHWFPDDSGGNIYTGVRDIAPSDFNWRGTNYLSYTNTWFKKSNSSENDWTDLLGLLRIVGTNDLFNSASVESVVDVQQWMTYLAFMAICDSRESTLNTGANDDYFLYAGTVDPRFLLVAYDLDTIVAQGDTVGKTNDTIFGAAAIPAFNMLLHSPDFEPVYYRTLQRLLDTTFSKNEFDSTVDQTLGSFVPTNIVASMKTWMDGRRAYVESLVAPYLTTNAMPVVATVFGEPRWKNPFRTATLTVGGDGVTQYRYKLNGGDFGPTNSIATPIFLTDLPDGANHVEVIGAGTNGIWQTISYNSRTWFVDTTLPPIRINEVLAANLSELNHNGTFPDAIELFNEGSATVDLSGMRLSDKSASPNKFTFPNGTTLAPGNFVVVFANNEDGTPGLHTGFSLDQDGEGVFLFDTAAHGNIPIDFVFFGLQLPDFSIGRIGGAGEFVLMQPSFESTNVAQPMGDPRKLKINEWFAAETFFDSPDFVELYNPEPLPVAFGDLFLTDNPIGEKAKFRIPSLSFIAPHGFRSFKADDDTASGNNHLNFKLSTEQGFIALIGFETIDVVAYGPQRPDLSEGRTPVGGNTISFFPTPTPAASNSSSLDSDNDGLPDDWEVENGLDRFSSAGDNGANGNPDGDSENNLQEFLAGTNPRDASDYLKIESARLSGNNVILRFHAAANRSYSILFSDNLLNGPWQKLVDVPATANPIWSETSSPRLTTGNRFYRLVAPALPNP